MSWILDLIFFLILILGTAYGAYKGFVASVLKLATTFFTLIIAFTFCVAFSNFLESVFGMTTALAKAMAGSIGKNEAYAVAIGIDSSGAEIGTALAGMDINGISKWFIRISLKSVELIPAEATPAMLIAMGLAKWISIVISFIGLIILIKLLALLIKHIFNAIKGKIKPLRVVDQFFGALLGLAKALVFIFIALLIVNWLPIESLHAFVTSSGVVGRIFEANWFQNATSYAISGKWFSDYIQGIITK